MLREFLLGFVKIHILHHASQQAVYGLGLIEELRQHGYEVQPGTLYPTLAAMERSGYLRREERVVDGRVRKYYVATSVGRSALEDVRPKLRELVGEVLAGPAAPHTEGSTRTLPGRRRARTTG